MVSKKENTKTLKNERKAALPVTILVMCAAMAALTGICSQIQIPAAYDPYKSGTVCCPFIRYFAGTEVWCCQYACVCAHGMCRTACFCRI